MTTLSENIAQAIADNSFLTNWCLDKYEQWQTVQLGIDLDRLPADNEYPIAMVAQVSGLEGKAVAMESAEVVITCGIADESDPVTVDHLKKFNQVNDLEDFRQLVLAAVETADLFGGYVEQVQVENDPVEMFPIFSTNMIVRIKYPAPMRGRWDK